MKWPLEAIPVLGTEEDFNDMMRSDSGWQFSFFPQEYLYSLGSIDDRLTEAMT